MTRATEPKKKDAVSMSNGWGVKSTLVHSALQGVGRGGHMSQHRIVVYETLFFKIIIVHQTEKNKINNLKKKSKMHLHHLLEECIMELKSIHNTLTVFLVDENIQ